MISWFFEADKEIVFDYLESQSQNITVDGDAAPPATESEKSVDEGLLGKTISFYMKKKKRL